VVVDVAELCTAGRKGVSNSGDSDSIHTLESGEGTPRSSSLLKVLIGNRTLMAYMAVMIYLWCANVYVYYGLSLFSSQLLFDRYWKHVLIGLVEVPSSLVSPVILDKMVS